MYRGRRCNVMLEFDRVKIVWGSDDMGFKTGTLISPDDLREFVLPGHKLMAQMSHDAGRPYLLHACGNLGAIMDDLIEDVRIDAKHSFEDTIVDVDRRQRAIRRPHRPAGRHRRRFPLPRQRGAGSARACATRWKVCLPGGGYCLGTGNSVANYIPLDNYLAMMDEDGSTPPSPPGSVSSWGSKMGSAHSAALRGAEQSTPTHLPLGSTEGANGLLERHEGVPSSPELK